MKNKLNYLVHIIILTVLLLIQFFGVANSLENQVSDRFYQDGEKVSPYIYVVGIDEETLSQYGSFDVWGRDKIADVINLLNADESTKPAVIGIDVGFYGEKESTVDDKLVEAVKNAGNVVLASSATFGSVVEKGSQVIVYETPFEKLSKAGYAIGHTNVFFDEDGVVRRALGNIKYNNETISSFDYQIYKAYLEHNNKQLDENSPGYFGKDNFYINFSGQPRAYYGSVGAGCSLYKVLDGSYPARAFKDAIVLIGAYASGTQDNYYTAINKETQMYGVEIHANIINQLVDGIYKSELNNISKLIPTLIMGIIIILMTLLLPEKILIPVTLLLSGAYVFVCKYFYNNLNLILPILIPILVLLITLIIHIIIRYFVIHKEKQRIIANYGKYLSPEVAKQIADQGEDSLSLGGIKKDIAVLFVDIRGFTPLSESLPPERVVEMLNSYLQITTTAIFNHEGTVDKFIGDATMGVFNAPLDLEDYTLKAVRAGLQMAKMAETLDDKLPEDLKGRVGFGVGINCGEAIVGNVGTNFRMEYTAIGDTVNTASRLEGQAKAGTVIISKSVYERVKDKIECEDAGKVKLKGKAEELQIYKAIREKDDE